MGGGVTHGCYSSCPHLCSHPQLFVVGGFDGLCRLHSVERYDPFSNTWAAAAPLLEAVSSAAVAPCAGQLYVIGGAGKDGLNTDKVGAWGPRGRWRLQGSSSTYHGPIIDLGVFVPFLI